MVMLTTESIQGPSHGAAFTESEARRGSDHTARTTEHGAGRRLDNYGDAGDSWSVSRPKHAAGTTQRWPTGRNRDAGNPRDPA
jgi:hypothetical protein